MLLIGFLSLGLICWLICRQFERPQSKSEGARLAGCCPGCHAAVQQGWMLCPECQTLLHKSCPECGQVHDRWFSFCPWCGHAAATVNGS